jgi:hypothetical protein
MTVEEMLERARVLRDCTMSEQQQREWAYTLVRAVIELLSAQTVADEPFHVHVHSQVKDPLFAIELVCHGFWSPTEARGLAVALLRAADEAEKGGAW